MVAAIWLQTMTGLVAHGAIALVAMETAARGPTLQCIHAHLDACLSSRVVLCHRWCLGSKHCDAPF